MPSLLKQGMTFFLDPGVYVGHATLPVNSWACVAISCQLLLL